VSGPALPAKNEIPNPVMTPLFGHDLDSASLPLTVWLAPGKVDQTDEAVVTTFVSVSNSFEVEVYPHEEQYEEISSSSPGNVTSMTNPLAATGAIISGSASVGSRTSDAATAIKAVASAASGKGVKNPAEAISSVGGAIDAARGVAKKVGSYTTLPSPPPAPKAPGIPSCSSTPGACQ